MTTIEFPALDGRDPLGFLTALGVLALTHTEHPKVRLSFSPDTALATLHNGPATITDTATLLARIVARTDPPARTRAPDTGQRRVLPGCTSEFPLRGPITTAGTGPRKGDPMRVPRHQFRTVVDHLAAIDPHAVHTWLPSLVTDLATDNTGRTALTPFTAPAGRQTLDSFFTKPLDYLHANPDYLAQALTGWRRVPGCTGEYLDHRATRDAADIPNPPPNTQSPMTGVPGATWLAEMALPLLRVTGDGTHVRATLWHRHRDRDVMIWPLWAPPLDIHAVAILLEHPTLRPRPTRQLTVSRTPLATLGVFTVRAAHRIPGPKSAGTLAPIPITTQVDTEPD